MPASWELVITGCGTSHGNPPWGVPQLWSEDPRDLRRRSGAMAFGPAGEVLLIDTGPDLMHQLRDPDLSWDGRSYPSRCVARCDAVLMTHEHADHAHGLNDLRHLNRLMDGRQIPVYGHGPHLQSLVAMFPYCFGRGDDIYRSGSPSLFAQVLEDDRALSIAGLDVTPFAMSHGLAGRTTGYRLGDAAYLTDLKDLPRAADRLLAGLDLLVLDMLREQPHETHLCWAEAQAIIARLRPRRTVLTHMGHEVRYAEWADRLPAGVVMAVDGMRLPFAAS
jgi:phosphoribosyl 1,2-cyclic phosphate phosphodiesterase